MEKSPPSDKPLTSDVMLIRMVNGSDYAMNDFILKYAQIPSLSDKKGYSVVLQPLKRLFPLRVEMQGKCARGLFLWLLLGGDSTCAHKTQLFRWYEGSL
ncbi:MAG: hypothetical protein V2G33_04330, partial [bacterium JZ-2024 1]